MYFLLKLNILFILAILLSLCAFYHFNISCVKLKNNTSKGLLLKGVSYSDNYSKPDDKKLHVYHCYYVDQNNPQASDNNSGIEDEPWMTISHATSIVECGDTVIVKKGIYREQITVEKSGTNFNNMITFMANPDDEVIIKGSDIVTDWRRSKGNIWKKENWEINSQQVFCDGEILQQIGAYLPGKIFTEKVLLRVGNGQGDMTPGSFYWDHDAKILYIWLKDSSNPNNHLIEVSVRPFFFHIKNQNFIKISGFKMAHSSTANCFNWPAFKVQGNFNVIENNYVYKADFIGCGSFGSNNMFYKNVFSYCGNSGMGLSGWGHRLIDNETSYNNYRNFNTDWHAGGIKAIPWVHDTLVSGHIAHDNIGPGIWFDGYCSNITIDKSLSYDNTGNGIFYEISERGVIKNNICYNNKERGIYISSSSDCGVFHNLVYNNWWEGITVMNAGRESAFGNDKKLEVKNNYVIGNIVMNNGKPNDRAELNIEVNSELAYNNISDYNIFWRNQEDGRIIQLWTGWGVEKFNNLQSWQQSTGRDTHSLFLDPKFINSNLYDFHLLPDSPAISFVKPIMSVIDDFNGNKRNLYEPRDAGPYNFVPEKK